MTRVAGGSAGPPPDVAAGATLLLADVGNSRIKLARLGEPAAACGAALPPLSHRQNLDSQAFRPENLERWLLAVAPGPAVILVASVHDAAASRLEAAIAEISATAYRPIRQRRIGHADLPLEVRLPEPHRVGIDRLAGAAACRFVVPAGKACVLVDCGTAATVDLISADGGFLGGAILPGPALMARALAGGTSRLTTAAAEPGPPLPEMPGRSTAEAIAVGIGLGIQGAIARLETEARAALGPDAVTVLTGGWRAAVRGSLPNAIEVPDLVLAGIALAAARSGGP